MADTADQPSKLWRLALILSLLLLAAASYAKIEPFRDVVDQKYPWIKDELASHGIHLAPSSTAPEPTPTAHPAVAKAAPSPAKPASSVEEQKPASVPSHPAATPAAAEVSAPAPQPVTAVSKDPASALGQLMANRALWPKTVRLKQAATFAAVVDRKKVGEISVPAGTEVKLMLVQADKIGVAYSPDGKENNLGGAYLQPDATDLFERFQGGIR